MSRTYRFIHCGQPSGILRDRRNPHPSQFTWIIGCAMVLCAGAIAPTVSAQCTRSVSPDRWKVEYFNGRALQGTAKAVVDDGNGFISHNWGTASPSSGCGVGSDNFSARWSRTVTLPAGTFEFTVISDDGVRMWIDGVLVLDKWVDQPPTTYTVQRALAGGPHQFILQYYENAGGALIDLRWRQLPCITTVAADHWKGEYFANRNLQGPALMVVDDGTGFLQKNWGLASPSASCGIPADSFSARWTSTIATATRAPSR